MRKKWIFFDVDGTLLNDEKCIPGSAKKAVEALKAAGHEVAIATGRAPFMIQHVREALGIDTFVSFNGQFVVYKGEVIHKNPYRSADLENLERFAARFRHPLVFMGEADMKANVKDNPLIRESLATLNYEHPAYQDRYYAETEIYQALLFCREEEEKAYASLAPFRIVRWHPYSADILPKNGSKAQGIKKLLEWAGDKPEDVIAFGDGANDIEMLSFAGIGVAMGNAVDRLKTVADFVTKPVDEDGIAYAVDQLRLA